MDDVDIIRKLILEGAVNKGSCLPKEGPSREPIPMTDAEFRMFFLERDALKLPCES